VLEATTPAALELALAAAESNAPLAQSIGCNKQSSVDGVDAGGVVVALLELAPGVVPPAI